MKKLANLFSMYFPLFILCFLLVLKTEISLSKTIQWNINKIIYNDIVVSDTDILIITPGVKVMFGPSVRMTVEGKLKAMGTVSSKITFTCYDSLNFWNCIEFKGPEIPELEFCVFEKTKSRDNIDGALHFGSYSKCNGLKNCIFSNNLAGAVYIGIQGFTPDITFENLMISSSDNFGITVSGGTFNNMTFLNNIISGKTVGNDNIGFTGIRLKDILCKNEVLIKNNEIHNGDIAFSSSIFSDSPGGALLIEVPELSDIASVKMEKNLFSRNRSKFAAATIQSASVNINNLSVEDNEGGDGGCMIISDIVSVINSNFIRNNKINDPQSKIEGGGGLSIMTKSDNSQVTISQCVFNENKIYQQNGGGLRIIGNGRSLAFVKILNSRFNKNTSNLGNGGAVAVQNLSTVQNIEFGNNKFMENNTQYGDLGGGGIFIEGVNEVFSLSVINSDSIKNNSAEKSGNGGFMSVNNVKKIGNLNYTGNTHYGISKAESSMGKGGLIFLDIGKLDYLNFSDNHGILSGIAGNAGGLLFSRNNETIEKISINRNDIIKAKALGGEGGAFYLNQVGFTVFEFKNNKIDSTYAFKSGGVLYLNFSKGQNIILTDNQIVKTSSNGDGGGFFLNNSDYPGSFYTVDFKNNQIENSDTYSGSGGVFSLLYGSGNMITIESNQIGKSTAGKSGGSFYLEGEGLLENSMVLNNNSFNKSKSRGGNGGVLFFHGTVRDNSKTFQLNGNNVKDSTYAFSKGGFAYFEGTIEQSFVFQNNTVFSASANEDGGLLCFNPNTISANKLTFSGNQVKKSSASVNGFGGILFGKGFINELEINNNIIKSSVSKNSGGSFYWSNQQFGSNQYLNVGINQNNIEKSISTEGSGGFLLLLADSVSSIKVENCSFGTMQSEMDGGGIYVNTNKGIGDISLNYNTFLNSSSLSGNGGIFDFHSQNLVYSLVMRENDFKGGVFSAKGNGGIINIQTPVLLKVSLIQNEFWGMLKSQNGGFINIFSDLPANSITKQMSFLYNTVYGTIQVGTNGGFVCYTGKNNQSLAFNNNVFQKSVRVGNSGGLIYFNNTGGENESVELLYNRFVPLSNDTLIAKTGGFIHYEGSFMNPSLRFAFNVIKKAKAIAAGGAIYINNAVSGYKQNTLSITNNRFENMTAGSNGAVLSFNGCLDKQLLFANDTLNGISVIGVNPVGGGTLYLNNSNCRVLSKLTVDSNSGQKLSSIKCSAAFLKYIGTVIDSVSITRNRFDNVSSDLTGALDFEIEEITSLKSSNNRYENVIGQNGAAYFLSGTEGSSIHHFKMKQDTLNSVKATKNGGGLFFNKLRLDHVEFDSLILDKVSAGEAGGFSAATYGIRIEELNLSGCKINNCSAGTDGGVMSLTGNLGVFDIYDNVFGNNWAIGKGGTFYLTGSGSLNKQLKVNADFQNSGNVISGEGGSLYIQDWHNASFVNSSFNKIKSKRSGGGINAGNIDSLSVWQSEFVFNESSENDGGAMAFSNIRFLSTGNNWFNSNLAHSGKGGCLYFTNGIISMKHDSVLYNEALTGAGIYLATCDGRIDSTYFVENKVPDINNSESQGGALYLGLPKDTGLVVKDCSIYRNQAFLGGGIFMKGSKARFIRDKFAFNIAKRTGAGCSLDESSDNSFYNCIFKSNQVLETFSNYINSIPVGGIHIYYGDNDKKVTRIINTVFHGNYGLAIGIAPNSSLTTTAYCQIKNSILFNNKYLNETNYQFFPVKSSQWLNIDYSCIQDMDLSVCPTCIKNNPEWNLPESYCLLPTSKCFNRGDPSIVYMDRDKSLNDLGITGGPYAFLNCQSTGIKDDYAVVGSEDFVFSASHLTVYPNPATGIIFISPGLQYYGDVMVEIISISGRILKNIKLTLKSPGERMQLDLRSLPKGVYMIKIRNKNLSDLKKVILM